MSVVLLLGLVRCFQTGADLAVGQVERFLFVVEAELVLSVE